MATAAWKMEVLKEQKQASQEITCYKPPIGIAKHLHA
jgi:hypothetical protein